MPKNLGQKLRKKTLNIATLSINARKTAGIYRMSTLGSRGLDQEGDSIDSATVTHNTRASRKENVNIFG